MTAAEYSNEHAVRSAGGGQQKQRFFPNAALRTPCGAFIITADDEGNQVDCQKVNDKIIHVQIIARGGRFEK